METKNIEMALTLLKALGGIEDNTKIDVENLKVVEPESQNKSNTVLYYLAEVVEKLSKVEKQIIGEAQIGEEVNKFNRVEPNINIQSEERYQTIISYLMSLEVGIAKNNEGSYDFIKKYVDNFTANELANLLVSRNLNR